MPIRFFTIKNLMQNENKTLHTAFGVLALVLSLVVYMMTVQPTVPFWDCGEFTAAAVQQQVPHPPGAPMFLMLGKVFHLLPFGDEGWRVNLMSVVASAVSIWLLYLTIVRVIRNFYRESLSTIDNALAVYGSAFIGAMTFAVSDTFWFNAVESEVYAASQLFVSLVVWVMMVWNERADEPGSERYLLLIMYLIGLSTGVHLLAVLTMFSLGALIYLRRYNLSTKGTLAAMGITVIGFYITYYLIILKYPALLAGNIWQNSDTREFALEDNFLVKAFAIGLLGAAAYAIVWARKNNKQVLGLAAASFLLMIIGYSSYTHILIRTNSNPPMNENKPETLEKLVAYLGREQYGRAPNWPRRYQTEARFVNNYNKYGPWTPPPSKQVTKKNGELIGVPDYSAAKTNTAAELAYMFDYQINTMYVRYFLWNFAGRTSDVQYAKSTINGSQEETEAMNFATGYGEHWPVNFFAIPLLIGLFGMFFHFQRDWKMASVYMIAFLFMGVLAALQQNQQDPQPRERDYFYTGSYMVFALWVGVGAFGCIEMLRQYVTRHVLGTVGTLAALLGGAPIQMAAKGWFVHSRAGNYLAFDYAYNILQSAEKDAIIFTNGDNDTFPVWYLQDVAGVRRDVRLVNLSLGQTQWYIEQLKNREPWGARSIPLSFSDKSLTVDEDSREALTYTLGPAEEISIPVDRAIMAQFTNDTALLNNPVMKWTYTGMPYGNAEQGGRPMFVKLVQHKLVVDILRQTKFTRPVYYSSSVGNPDFEEFVGLGSFLRMEGLCFRVCPAPQKSAIGMSVNIPVTDKSLLQSLNDDTYHKEPHYGLKFRNLNNPNVYYDDVHRGYIDNYRNIFYRYAMFCIYDQKDTAKAVKILNEMNRVISPTQFPIDPALEARFMEVLDLGGDVKGTREAAQRIYDRCNAYMQKPHLLAFANRYGGNFQPEVYAAQAAGLLGRWNDARRLYLTMRAGVGNDPFLQYRLDELDILKLKSEKNYSQALALARELAQKYPLDAQDRGTRAAANTLYQHIDWLEGKLGIQRTVVEAPLVQ